MNYTYKKISKKGRTTRVFGGLNLPKTFHGLNKKLRFVRSFA